MSTESRFTSCPARIDLESFALGQADASAATHVESCGACQRVVHEIEEENALLRHAAGVTADDSRPSASAAGLRLAGYQITREIHRGGQGVVHLAVQQSTGREVAIKVMREGPFASPAERARFDREVRILAQLDHPNIVAIVDSGVAAGCVYFVMEFIHGQPLDEYVRGRQLPIEESLRLFSQVCDAVNAAHLQGIVHRDLKPSNVFVDPHGRPRVLDFGLAKMTALEAPPPNAAAAPNTAATLAATAMTRTGQFVGSLPWASPEQAQGTAGLIDLRTDVYSLGVILYQLMTGRFPYDVTGPMREVLNNIVAVEPETPSRVARGLDGELDTMVLKCLAKDRARRYQTAGELGRDIEHYLRDEPIDAKRDSTWYILLKTARRYRLPVGLSAAALVVLVAFAITMFFAYRKTAAAERATAAAERATAALLVQSNIERGGLHAVTNNFPIAERLLWHEFLTQAAGSAADRQALWALRELYSRQPCLARINTGIAAPARSYFAPDAPELITLGDNGVCKRWSLLDYRRLASFSMGGPLEAVTAVHGETAAIVLKQRGDRVVLASLRGGDPEHVLDWPDEKISAVAFARDGNWLVIGNECGQIRVYQTEPAPALVGEWTAHEGAVRGLCFSPDGAQVLSLGQDRTLRVWDRASQEVRLERPLPESPAPQLFTAARLEVSPDSRHFAITHAGESFLWDFPELRAHQILKEPINSFDFSPDGRRLVSNGAGHWILIWDVATGGRAKSRPGRYSSVCDVRFSSDGLYLASTLRDGSVQLWDAAQMGEPDTAPPPGATLLATRPTSFGQLVLSSADDQSFAAGSDGFIGAFNSRTGTPGLSFVGHAGSVLGLALTPDNKRLISAGADGTIRVWDRQTGDSVAVWDAWKLRTDHPSEFKKGQRQLNLIRLTAAGHRLAAAGEDGAVSLWKIDNGECERVLKRNTDRVPTLAFAPDGRTLASGGHGDGYIVLWDVGTGQSLRQWQALESGVVRALAFGPDGRRLTSGGDDGLVKVWDTTTAECLLTCEGHQVEVFAVCFSPDGRLIASGEHGLESPEGGQFPIIVWDAETGRQLATFRSHKESVYALEFSSDNERLASCGGDGNVVMHDLTYFDRHIAGNLEAALHDADAEKLPVKAERIRQLREWARRVLNPP